MTVAVFPRAGDGAHGRLLSARRMAGLLLAAVVALCVLAVQALAPSPVAAGDAAARTASIVRELAQSPRVPGTAAHDAARDAIVRRLAEIGIGAEIQETVSTNEVLAQRWSAPTPVARVRNVVARLRGAQPAGALLLMAHYDSVVGSPGAADDASGVAAVLEAARSLAADPALPRDVILLFTDAEEAGLLGARAFVAQHAWARDVGAVINVEARGRGGPALVFEATPQGASILQQAAQSWPEELRRPLVGSLFFDVYALLANDTDLTPWRERGVAAFNIAFVAGLTHYHSALDTADNVDPASLQDQRDALLGLSRTALAHDPARGSGDPVVTFMSWPRHWHVVARSTYDAAIGITLALVAIGIVLALVRRRVRAGALALGTLAAFGGALAAAVAAQVFWLALRAGVPALAAAPNGEAYHATWHALGLALVAVGTAGLVARRFVRRHGAFALAGGALVTWSALLAVLWLVLPGAAYLPLAVVAPGVIAWLAHLLWPRGAATLAGIAGVVALVVVVPLTALLFSGLGILACAVPALLIGLLVVALAPLVATLDAALGAWPWRGALAGGALAVVAVAAMTPQDRAMPYADSLLYVVDADSGTARWATADAPARGRVADHVGSTPQTEPADSLPGWLPAPAERAPILPATLHYAPAPQADLPAPTFVIEHSEPADQGRRVRLRVTPGSGAAFLALGAGAPDRVRAAQVDGVALSGDLPGRPWSMRYWAPPHDGFVVELDVSGTAPLPLWFSEQTPGLPAALARDANPSASVPLPYMGFLADATVVVRRAVID